MKMNINQNAPVRAAKEIYINACPEKVWHVLTSIDSWPSWQPQVVQARLNGKLKPGTTFDWKSGGTKIHSSIHTVDPFKSFGWTGKALGTYAIHNWILEEKEGATLLKTEESMQGLLAVVLKGMLNKTLNKGMDDWLGKLKIRAEEKGS